MLLIWEIVFEGCRSQTMDNDVLDERLHTTNYESRVIDIKIREQIITDVRGRLEIARTCLLVEELRPVYSV